MVDLGPFAVRIRRQLHDGAVEYPGSEADVLVHVFGRYVHPGIAQPPAAHGAPVFDELVLVALGYRVGVLPAERFQLALVSGLQVVAFRVAVDVAGDGLAIEIATLGQPQRLVLRVDVALELAFHLVEGRRGHVRVVVPAGHELQIGAVGVLGHQLRHALRIDHVAAGGLGDGHRPLDHARAVQHGAMHHAADQRLIVTGAVRVDVLQLVVDHPLGTLGDVQRGLLHQQVEVLLGRLRTGVRLPPLQQRCHQGIHRQVRYRRRLDAPVLLAGGEQQGHQARLHAHALDPGDLGVGPAGRLVHVLQQSTVVLAEELVEVFQPLGFRRTPVTLELAEHVLELVAQPAAAFRGADRLGLGRLVRQLKFVHRAPQ
ncbi:hypothetical protein D3C81_1015850 [compost metagenome]